MRTFLLSDTHGCHANFFRSVKDNPLAVDLIIHGGDFTNIGKPSEIEAFNKWVDSIKGVPDFVFIAGNHDFGMEGVEPYTRITPQGMRVHYLCNSSVEIQGRLIYGSPHTPEFFNWAFMYPRSSSKATEIWRRIPQETDILVTHGPRYGILDQCNDFKTGNFINVGCSELGSAIDKLPNLKSHIFGHIHPAGGQVRVEGVNYYNVSIVTDDLHMRSPEMVYL